MQGIMYQRGHIIKMQNFWGLINRKCKVDDARICTGNHSKKCRENISRECKGNQNAEVLIQKKEQGIIIQQ
jgi:orotate phosphoribosyltransferase-like protein